MNPTLCLNMIVKNESKIITRLFDSIINIIDCYCICDTGSSDNTIELIEEYFKKKNINGKVIEKPFKNFCFNRNYALKSCYGMSDYVLLLDADMILKINNFDKTILNLADSFFILQGNDTFYYQNIRIIKNNELYSYIGVTHEYINCPVNNSSKFIKKDILFISDIGDGGSKNDKFERDINLLLDGIKEEPNNERYYFYLANSYHDLGMFSEAIDYYKKRIEMKGWNEEVWYSYYKIGLSYKNIKKIENAIYYWLLGYDFYPDRLEGIYEIIKYFRIEQKYKLAEIYYKVAVNILDKKLNRDQYLFLHNDIYTNKIYFEYIIIASYLGVSNINNEVIHFFNNSIDNLDKYNVLQNMKFYKHILKQNNKIIFDDFFVASLKNKNININSIKFKSSSSCLIKTYDGYQMNIRYVNYHINDEGNYENCDKQIITINKYLELNNFLNLKNHRDMNLLIDDKRYIGIEDVKIFNDINTNQLLFIGTALHKNNKLGIVMGKYDINKLFLERYDITTNFNNNDCEKNWVFVNYLNETHIIYDWYLLKICKIDNNNQLTLIDTRPMPLLFSFVRGSTNGFNYASKEIWFVTHIVSNEKPRHYYHLITVFDLNMNLLRYSAPFKFEGEPIEFCLSILVEDDRVLINYSTWDRTTRIGVYDKIYIDSIVCYS